MNPNLIYMMTFLPAIIYHNTDTTQHNTKKKKDKDSPLYKITQNKVPHRHTPIKNWFISIFYFFFYRQLRRLENKETKQKQNMRKKEREKKKHDKCL